MTVGRRSWRVCAAIGATALILGAFTTGPAGATGPDTATGGAYGLDVSLGGTSLIGPTPTVTLPASGTLTTASTVSASLPTVVSSGTLTV